MITSYKTNMAVPVKGNNGLLYVLIFAVGVALVYQYVIKPELEKQKAKEAEVIK